MYKARRHDITTSWVNLVAIGIGADRNANGVGATAKHGKCRKKVVP